MWKAAGRTLLLSVVVEEARLLRKELDPTIRKGKRVLRHYVQIYYGEMTKALEDCFMFLILIMAEEALHHCVRIRERQVDTLVFYS